MATIYKDPITGQQVYDDPLKGIVSATTGQVIHPSPNLPKIGDPISGGGGLRYEAEDIMNLQPSGLTLQQAEKLQSEVINTDSLVPTSPLNLPSLTAKPNYLSYLNSIPFPQPTSQTETVQTDLLRRTLEISEKLTGKKAAQIKAEEVAGVPGYQKELRDITSQIQTLQKEAAAIPLQLQEEAKGRGITAGGLQPIEAGLLRQNTIKALGLSAIAQTIQGNLALAQQQANRAVELEFAPMEAQLDFLKTAYNMNKDVLEREDKKRADALGLFIRERERLIAERKDAATEARKMAANAVANNPGNKDALLAANMVMDLNPLDPDYAKKVFQLVGQYQAKKEELSTDIKEFKAFFPNVDITTSAGKQQFLDWKAQMAAGRKPKGIETRITSEDRRTLIGSGLTDVMISNIEKGVRTIGIEEVLKDDYTDKQRAAIRKIYGAEVKEVMNEQILQAAKAMSVVDVENYFRARYTEDELKEFAEEAGFAGFFTRKATEIANYLVSPKAREKLAELLSEEYRKQGFTIK